MDWPSTAKWDAAQVDALAAVQQITQLFPPTSCSTSGSISLMTLVSLVLKEDIPANDKEETSR